jgi:hypothetical protein
MRHRKDKRQKKTFIIHLKPIVITAYSLKNVVRRLRYGRWDNPLMDEFGCSFWQVREIADKYVDRVEVDEQRYI